MVVDGLIATSAALIAAALAPDARGYMIAGHRSAEPGHNAALAHLGLTPVLDLNLRLGEGTGAVLAFHIVDAAARILGQMATFAEAGVSEKGGSRLMGDFLRALSLLTRLPVRARWDDDVLPGRAMAAYPLVGALIGTLLVGLSWLLTWDRGCESRPAVRGRVYRPCWPPRWCWPAWAALTGMLHLDGWADCCDALRRAPQPRAAAGGDEGSRGWAASAARA